MYKWANRPSIGPINNASTVINCKLISHVPSSHNSQCSEHSFAIHFTIHWDFLDFFFFFFFFVGHLALWIRHWIQDQRSLVFNSHYWSYAEVSGKLAMSYCHCLPNSDGYLVNENCEWVARADCTQVQGQIACVCSILAEETRLLKWCVPYTS